MVGITCILNTKSCRKISDIFGNCSQCYSGYTVTAGSCTLCPFSGCDLTNTTTAGVVANVCTCTACSSGFYLSGVACLACTATNCDTCPTNTCNKCKTGFHLSVTSCISNSLTNCLTSASSSACTTCANAYYKGTDNLCYSCQTNCLKCLGRF